MNKQGNLSIHCMDGIKDIPLLKNTIKCGLTPKNTHNYTNNYIYIKRERERERERDLGTVKTLT